MRRNVDVLMDRAPAGTVDAALAAIEALDPPVDVHRFRLREAAGRTFADVVIGVEPGAAVGQGHAAADRVEQALERALPGIDVVVHVEPLSDEDAALRERVRAAAATVSHVREIHDVMLIDTDEGTQVSLHLKLPHDLPLEEAHDGAEQVERAILGAVPGVRAVQTHLEPLVEASTGRPADAEADLGAIEGLVAEACGSAPREVRALSTPQGLVVLVTIAVGGETTLADAHDRAGAVARRVREALPGTVADVVVHTEP
jgi:divalent metal cation (Fe/Co/Zn/Cd) transporter